MCYAKTCINVTLLQCAVKKKKLYERALDVLDKQLMNLRTQIESE